MQQPGAYLVFVRRHAGGSEGVRLGHQIVGDVRRHAGGSEVSRYFDD